MPVGASAASARVPPLWSVVATLERVCSLQHHDVKALLVPVVAALHVSRHKSVLSSRSQQRRVPSLWSVVETLESVCFEQTRRCGQWW